MRGVSSYTTKQTPSQARECGRGDSINLQPATFLPFNQSSASSISTILSSCNCSSTSFLGDCHSTIVGTPVSLKSGRVRNSLAGFFQVSRLPTST
eukprot:m.12995 g.12995  ORF g.12995 m.12995 type:complete len:95 (+) comp10074_c0_seq1:97-381(+)